MATAHDNASLHSWQELTSFAMLVLFALHTLTTIEFGPIYGCPSQARTVEKDFGNLHMSLEMYVLTHGHPPATLRTLVDAGLINKLRSDPWGTPYSFTVARESLHFVLRSAGPDRQFGTEDDILPPSLAPAQSVASALSSSSRARQ